MPISFDAIPIDIRVPGQYVEIDPSAAARADPGMPVRVLLLGQKLTGGTAEALVPVRVFDARAAEPLFGRGSMLHRMILAYRAVDPRSELWAIPQADAGAGVAATKTLTVGGTVTAAGTLALSLGGQRVRIAVPAGQAAATTATAIAAAVTADAMIPFTAAAASAVVTLTARHKGELGQALDVRANVYEGEALPSGMTLAIADGTAGSGNPDIGDAIAVMGDTWYTDIICPYSDAANLDALEAELSRRFGPLVAQDAHGYTARAGTAAQLSAAGAARNSPHLTTWGFYKPVSPIEEWAAAAAAHAVASAKQDPAMPVTALAIPAGGPGGLKPPAAADRFTQEEQNALLYDGISTWTVDPAGRLVLSRTITGYQRTALGAEDPGYLQIETMKTIAWYRYTLRARVAVRFGRHKLGNDGDRFGAGQRVATPKVIMGEILAHYREGETRAILSDFAAFKADSFVERDDTDRTRVNAILRPRFVGQMFVFAARVQFLL